MAGRISALDQLEAGRLRRIEVYLDGRRALRLSPEVASGLRVGQYLTEEEIADLLEREEVQRATDVALGFLSYRPRSEREVRVRLRRKGFSEPIIEAVVPRLRRLGLLDDREFARFWVEQRRSHRPRGERLVERELRQKGVDPDTIGEAVREMGDEEELAYQAGLRKARTAATLDYRAFRQKMGAYLVRRGFSYSTAHRAVQRLWEETRAGAEAVPGQPPHS